MRRSRIRDEELNQILTNNELDDVGKADAIKTLVGKSFVPTSKYNTEKQNTKAQIDAYNTLKNEYEAFKQSKMTDEEKQAEKAKLMQEQYQKANLTISKMYAENTFAKAGFQEDDYKGILDNIVTEDPDKTKGLAEIICNTMLKQKKDIEKAITDKIVKNNPKPPAGNDDGSGNETDIEKYQKLYADAQKRNDYSKMAYYTRLIQESKKNNEE